MLMMAPPSVPNPLLLEEGAAAAAAAAAHGNMASLHQRDVDRGLFRPPARPRPPAARPQSMTTVVRRVGCIL